MGRRPVLAAILCVTALAAAGCAGGDRAAATTDGRLTVVATTTQLADFTRNVGGDRVEVVSILKPNVDSHDFDPTPADIDAIARTPVLVANGVGLESWLDDTIEASGFDGSLVDTSEGVPLLSGPADSAHHHGEAEAGHGHEAEDQAHAEEGDAHAEEGGEHAAEEGGEHAEEGHAEERQAPEGQAPEGDAGHAEEHAEEGHDHGAHDPHIWQNPQNAEIMVRNIEEALVTADGDGADTYHANADAYVEELQRLDAEVEATLAPLANRKLVTNHEAFTYYADRYDLEFVGAIIPSFDTAAELSAREVTELVTEIRETGVKAVFSETSLAPETAETIAGEAGVKVVTGEDALYGDSLGPEGSPGATYIGAIRHNTETIATNLG